MINETLYGQMLEGKDGYPPLRILTRVEGECGCHVYCGTRMDLLELAIVWFPCDAHMGEDPAGPQQRFRRSLEADPQARPVWDVVDEMLAEANA